MGRFLILALLLASPAAIAGALASPEPASPVVDVDMLLDSAMWVDVNTDADNGASDEGQDTTTGNVMPEDDDVVDVTTACSGSTCEWASRTDKRTAPFESTKDRRLRPPRA